MRRLIVSWTISLALLASPALAQVYKWVDESGKVNYGDRAPSGSKGALLGAAAGVVNIVPGIPKEELDRLRKQDEQRRLERLEREVDELRTQSFARVNVAPETVYTEVYVPIYGYLRPRRPFPGIGVPGAGPPVLQPVQPIVKPVPPARPRQRSSNRP